MRQLQTKEDQRSSKKNVFKRGKFSIQVLHLWWNLQWHREVDACSPNHIVQHKESNHKVHCKFTGFSIWFLFKNLRKIIKWDTGNKTSRKESRKIKAFKATKNHGAFYHFEAIYCSRHNSSRCIHIIPLDSKHTSKQNKQNFLSDAARCHVTETQEIIYNPLDTGLTYHSI